MAERPREPHMPGLPGLIAGGLVVLGVLLFMFVSKGLLVIAGLGAFGPGMLRELGWLRDQDEFQRQSAYRAGYQAYLIGGLTTVLVVSALSFWEATLKPSAEWIRLILVVLWMSWLFSALLAYWGARKTASRILVTFGAFWAVFVIASAVGESRPDGGIGELLLGLLMGFVFVGPFFVGAWAAGRRPRLTGVILLGMAAIFFVLTVPTSGALAWSSVLLTDALLLVPLVATGIALLREADAANEIGKPADAMS